MSRFWCRALIVAMLVFPSGQGFAQAPDKAESDLFAVARNSGQAADYRAYLTAYPEGAFAEIAKFELEWTDPDAAPVTPGTTTTVMAGLSLMQTDIGFDTPLTVAPVGHSGASIADLIKGTPLFPPIEGIPEELWKDQHCTNCHQWTKEALCDQGKTYSTEAGVVALAKPHPYGGPFKAALKVFAAEGCK